MVGVLAGSRRTAANCGFHESGLLIRFVVSGKTVAAWGVVESLYPPLPLPDVHVHGRQSSGISWARLCRPNRCRVERRVRDPADYRSGV